MSRLTDLIAQVKAKDPELGKELEREFKTYPSWRPVLKGDKVSILPPRGSTQRDDPRQWRVHGFTQAGGKRATRVKQFNAAVLAANSAASLYESSVGQEYVFDL